MPQLLFFSAIIYTLVYVHICIHIHIAFSFNCGFVVVIVPQQGPQTEAQEISIVIAC